MRTEKVKNKTKNQLAEEIFVKADKLSSFPVVVHDNN